MSADSTPDPNCGAYGRDATRREHVALTALKYVAVLAAYQVVGGTTLVAMIAAVMSV